MAGSLGTVTGVGILRSGVTCMARIRGQTGQLITRASLSTITYAVRNLTSATTITSAQSLTISSVVYDDLQVDDPRWDRDNEEHPGPDEVWGYNFLATIAASHFTGVTVADDEGVLAPNAVTPHKFQVAITFTPASGQPFVQPFEFMAIPVWES